MSKKNMSGVTKAKKIIVNYVSYCAKINQLSHAQQSRLQDIILMRVRGARWDSIVSKVSFDVLPKWMMTINKKGHLTVDQSVIPSEMILSAQKGLLTDLVVIMYGDGNNKRQYVEVHQL